MKSIVSIHSMSEINSVKALGVSTVMVGLKDFQSVGRYP